MTTQILSSLSAVSRHLAVALAPVSAATFRRVLRTTSVSIGHRCASAVIVMAMVLGMASTSLQAGVATWDGGGAELNPSWSTATNWSKNKLPASGADIRINAVGFGSGVSTITLGASRTVGTLTFSTSTIPVTLSGSAGQTLTLNGNLTVTSGNQTLSVPVVMSVAGTWTVASGSSLSVPGTLGLGGNLTLNNNGTTTLSGVISGIGRNVVLSGTSTGTLTLSNANLYTGTTSALSGTLVIGNPSALGNASTAVSLGGTANASLLINGGHAVTRPITVLAGATGTTTIGGSTAASSTFSGALTLNKAVQLTAASGGTTTFSGVLNDGAGTFGVTKTGAGTVILSNASLYDGGTTISAGTLLVTNATGSATGTNAVSVASGATLGGTGIMSGNVSVLSGGTLSPGNPASSPGTLTIGGSLSFATGSNYAAQINGTTAGQFDRINAGSINLGTNVTNLVLANTTTWSGKLFLSSGTVTGTFKDKAEGTLFASGGRVLQISYVGGISVEDKGSTGIPSLFAVSPATGYTLGGSSVTVSGANFDISTAITVRVVGVRETMVAVVPPKVIAVEMSIFAPETVTLLPPKV